jgi:hypothetical protein
MSAAGGSGDELSGVSCSSSVSCMAVGTRGTSATYALAEQWNGTKWAVEPTPSLYGGLTGVSCTSSTFCIATGPQLEQWNGTAWTVQAAPKSAGGLDAVSCVSQTFCMAVGPGNGDPTAPALAERWNGTSWAVVPTPRFDGHPAQSLSLLSVACTSASACTAVGHGLERGVPDTPYAALVEHWDGTHWTIQKTPVLPKNRREYEDQLTGVSCPSATSCTAVGSVSDNNGPGGTGWVLIEHWNGRVWALDRGANRAIAPGRSTTGESALNAVSCASSTRCVATGSWLLVGPHGGKQGSLAEGWNGSQWTLQSASTAMPHSGNEGPYSLNGVSCVPTASICTAVGTQAHGKQSAPLAEQLGTLPSAIA